MSNVSGGFGAPTYLAPTPSYGSDLDCLSDLTGAMAETSGLHMLTQALCRRLITPRGTLIDDPNYGFDVRQFLGADLGPADIARIQAGIDAELLKDERILSSQSSVTLAAVAGVLTIGTTITPSAGPTFQLVLAVSSVTTTLLAPTL